MCAKICFIQPVYLLICLVLCHAQFASAQRLEILPAEPKQTKLIGKSLLLTCKSDVSDPESISELHWIDNHGRRVEKLEADNNYLGYYEGGYGNPAMYTEVLPDSGVTLNITSLTVDMAGVYTCHAYYANTGPLKATVTVRTIDPIKWFNAPENQFAIINKDYKIRCEVEADPPPTVEWLKDGESISTNDKYEVGSRGLIVKNVQESDDGVYVCRAAVMSTGEVDERHIRVEVQIPPVIEPMNRMDIVEGDMASIQCTASGKPPPTYTWIKKSTMQDLSKTDRFSVNKNSGLLDISRVEYDDHSDYECVAKNTAAKVTREVRINVLMKPKIYELANVTAPENQSTRLICKVQGRPAPMVTFKKIGSQDYFIIGQQLNNDKIILEQQVYGDETYGVLTFTKLNRSDEGLYECIAENKAAKSWKYGHVTVQFAPTFANSKGQPPVWTWNRKPGNLSCIAEAIPNATYEWRLNEIPIKSTPPFKVIIKNAQSFLIVQTNDKRLFTRYKCIAINPLGTSEHYVELKQAHPPQPVQQAKVISVSATTIQFDIDGPAVLDGLPISAFIVQFKDEREHDWNRAKNKTWSFDSTYIVEYLEPEKTYNFRFAAFNDVGIGDWGVTQIQTMPRRSAPNEPIILNSPVEGIVTSPYSDHFDLEWKIPADNGEPINLYQIKFCPVQRVNDEWQVSPDGCNSKELSGNDLPEMSISPLNSGTHYKIELRARNSIGFSTPAELIVKTAGVKQYYNACSVCVCNMTLFIFLLLRSMYMLRISL